MDAIEQLALLAKGFPPNKKKPAPQDEEQDTAQGAGDDALEPGEDESDGGGDAGDADGDGVPNADDEDSDGDGMADRDEPHGELEHGDADELEDELEGDEEPDGDELGEDTDADGDGMAAGGGDIPSIIAQVIKTERDYYAAVGHAGDTHYSTKRAIDLHHRAVRKLVRALQAQGGSAAALAEGAEGDDEGDEQGGEGPGLDATGLPPRAPANDNGKGAAADMDADDDADTGGDDDADEGAPPKKKPGKPFGKSLAAHYEAGYRLYARQAGLFSLLGLVELRKGTWDFRDVENASAVPEQFLMPYLTAFVEAAYNECCGDAVRGDAQKSASAIMLKLVALMPRSSNLRRAAVKYRITEDAIASILRDRGIIAPEARAVQLVGDAASFDVMGASALAGESLQRSAKVDWLQPVAANRDPRGSSSVLRLVPRQQFVRLEDDRGTVRVPAVRSDFSERDRVVKANVSAGCPIHSLSDVRKTDMLAHPFAKCSCPR